MSKYHKGLRSPTQRELDLDAPADPKKTIADLRAQLGEAQAWLMKIRAALRVESNAHALAVCAVFSKEKR